MLKAVVLVYIASSLVNMNPCTEEIVPAIVSRRPTGDFVNYLEPKGCDCTNEDNLTYLVDERQCVNNQDLLDGNHSSVCDFIHRYMQNL